MNSNGNWDLQIDPAVHKFLAKIPRQESARIILAIHELPADPFRGDIQKMRGEENIMEKADWRVSY